MEADAIKFLGAGLAAIGAGLPIGEPTGSLIVDGVGNVFAAFLQGALRNPSAAASQQGNMFIGFAAAELLGLLAFVVAVLLIFVA